MVLTALIPPGLSARGIADIITSLRATDCYEADVRFCVTLPQSDDDVIYDVRLASASGDALSPCRYLTDWSFNSPSGKTSGFSAYFDGHHYRFRNERLQEYHLEWDSVPFMKRGGADGVQATAQFTDLYPAFIAEELQRMCDDSRYRVTVKQGLTFDGRDAIGVESVFMPGGVIASEKSFIFDARSSMPLRIEVESNPGEIAEQTVFVTYEYRLPMNCPPLSEEALMERYPDEFGRYRESNFRIENLAGTAMPAFSLPTTTGERYTYHRGDGFASPTAIVLLDPAAGFNDGVVSGVRAAVDMMPRPADVIWVFNSTDIDAVEAEIPAIRPGEHLLINGRSLARDCGAASLPVIIMADSHGRVKDVSIGFNPDLRNIVLQTMALVD